MKLNNEEDDETIAYEFLSARNVDFSKVSASMTFFGNKFHHCWGVLWQKSILPIKCLTYFANYDTLNYLS